MTIFQHLLRVGLIACLAFALLLPGGITDVSVGHAQILEFNGSNQSEEGQLEDPLGRNTPRGLVTGLLNTLSLGEANALADYLAPPTSLSGPEWRYWHLLRILNALAYGVQLASPGSLSLLATGDQTDGLDVDLELLGGITGANGEADLQAVRRASDTGEIWVISEQSVQLLLDWQPVDASARAWFDSALMGLPEGPRLQGVPLRDWTILALLALGSYALSWTLLKVRRAVSRLFLQQADQSRLHRFVLASEPPLRLFLASVIFYLTAGQISVSVVARFQLVLVFEIAALISGAWLLWRLIDAIAGVALSKMSQRGAITAYSSITFLTRVGKTLLAAIFLTIMLRTLGIDVTAGLAALGVGGLMLALGAQKLIENLIGSVTLIADRPVRVGDFCRFGDTLGTIEEIGIRSTRIRTLTRTLVTVPNGEFSSLHLENFSKRDSFWFHHVIGVRYDTSVDSIQELLTQLQPVLQEHPDVVDESPRVRFIRFGAYSLDIELFAYVQAAEWPDFLAAQEQLMLDCMRCVTAKSDFAYPSHSVFLENPLQAS